MSKMLRHLLATLLVVAAPLANAAIITFNLNYSGASFGNGATAVGHVSFDDTILPTGPASLANVSAATLGVVGWDLTVSGATTGNGTFTLGDLAPQTAGWIWVATAPLNFALELVGQIGFSDFNWCAGSASCGNPAAPGGSSAFTIRTAGETGDQLRLISMNQSVPEPGSMALFALAGLAAAGVARRKQH